MTQCLGKLTMMLILLYVCELKQCRSAGLEWMCQTNYSLLSFCLSQQGQQEHMDAPSVPLRETRLHLEVQGIRNPTLSVLT